MSTNSTEISFRLGHVAGRLDAMAGRLDRVAQRLEPAADGTGSADVLPITVPSRSELWRRNQLVRSLLSHRPCTPDLAPLLIAVLDGDADLEGVRE